jgi:hypothetical protein
MYNYIKNIVASIKQWFADRFTPSVHTLVGALVKIENALEKAISKETRALEGLHVTRITIAEAIDTKNKVLDKSYKLLNNVSNLTK